MLDWLDGLDGLETELMLELLAELWLLWLDRLDAELMLDGLDKLDMLETLDTLDELADDEEELDSITTTLSSSMAVTLAQTWAACGTVITATAGNADGLLIAGNGIAVAPYGQPSVTMSRTEATPNAEAM